MDSRYVDENGYTNPDVFLDIFDNPNIITDDADYHGFTKSEVRDMRDYFEENLVADRIILDYCSHGWIECMDVYKIKDRYFAVRYNWHDMCGYGYSLDLYEVRPHEITIIEYNPIT